MESAIAIIGMACRFPGAETIEQFWENLCAGCETTTFFTDKELLEAGVDPIMLGNPHYVRAGQVLPDVELFDADYFGITAEEAHLLDPQQRHFLECSHEALERCGHLPDAEQLAVGVFAGVGLSTYLLNNLDDRYRAGSTFERYRLMLANDKDFLATRVSYKLNLRGPSVGVNTACSSSLVAIHLACVSLLAGECNLALAGGAHIKVPQSAGYLFQDGMIFSPDGHCRALDATARGTVAGNGVGVVILRRLTDALSGGDHIHAVIRGSAVNNDGATKAGYAAPSVHGQVAVITDAQQLAECPAATISYIEAHGTGTVLGDAVELTALVEVLGERVTPAERCAIGSVKSNIGHLDCTSGVAGLIKTALMLEHGQLVPSVNVAEPNPAITAAGSPLYVNTTLKDWPAGDTPRRAGVSSFGVGGTNAHVVIEEPPVLEPSAALDDWQLLVLSARSASALEKLTDTLARQLRAQRSTLNLADVARTLSVARRHHPHRRAVVCRDVADAALTLALRESHRVYDHHQPQVDGPTVMFVFADRLQDGGERAATLYRDLPAFGGAVDRLLAQAGPIAADPVELLRAGDHVAAIVAQCALAELWTASGVQPAALAGVGAGEFAAACVAGVFTIRAALALATPGSGGQPGELSPGVPNLPLWSAATEAWMPAGAATDPASWIQPRNMIADRDVTICPAGSSHLTVDMRPDALDAAASGREAFLRAVGRLWADGAAVDWTAAHDGQRRRWIPLPTAPFDRKRYWVEPPARRDVEAPAPPMRADALRQQMEDAEKASKIELIQTFIQREVAATLGQDPPRLVDLDADLFSLGIGSMDLIDIASRLSTELQEQIPLSLFVDRPTVRAYAENVVAALNFGPSGTAQPI
jgi:acyl transferase domain-containing protein